jgi:hypothetical protein
MTRWFLGCLAAAYLAGVWLDGVGSTLPSSILPRSANYFLQVSALFPYAALASIDYRAEGWVCANGANGANGASGANDANGANGTDGKWEEIDTRPYFPIDADNKENRFQRVMHFYRDNRPTMHALEAYLIEAHGEGRADDGIPRDVPIAGVRFSSLRIPLPQPGEPLTRSERKPLSEYPESERQLFYHTRRSKLEARCAGQHDSPGDESD